ALIASLSLAAGGTAGTASSKQGVTAATIQPPHVKNAKAIRKKYGGQQITFIGDNIGLTHKRDLKFAKRFTHDTHIKVKVIAHPAQGTDAYAQLARNFASHSSSVDVAMF